MTQCVKIKALITLCLFVISVWRGGHMLYFYTAVLGPPPTVSATSPTTGREKEGTPRVGSHPHVRNP